MCTVERAIRSFKTFELDGGLRPPKTRHKAPCQTNAVADSCQACVEGGDFCCQTKKAAFEDLKQANLHLTCQPNEP